MIGTTAQTREAHLREAVDIQNRPICLLNNVGKLVKELILSRLMVNTQKPDNSGVLNNQFGFQKGRSTMDAIGGVIKTDVIAPLKKQRGIRF